MNFKVVTVSDMLTCALNAKIRYWKTITPLEKADPHRQMSRKKNNDIEL